MRFFKSSDNFWAEPFNFFRLNESITDEIPVEINAKPVNTTNEIPVKIGLAIKMNERIILNTLTMAKFPQFSTPASFSSKAKPSSSNERNSNVKPTTNGNINIDRAGYISKKIPIINEISPLTKYQPQPLRFLVFCRAKKVSIIPDTKNERLKSIERVR